MQLCAKSATQHMQQLHGVQNKLQLSTVAYELHAQLQGVAVKHPEQIHTKIPANVATE